jgi:hypothetical protein
MKAINAIVLTAWGLISAGLLVLITITLVTAH